MPGTLQGNKGRERGKESGWNPENKTSNRETRFGCWQRPEYPIMRPARPSTSKWAPQAVEV